MIRWYTLCLKKNTFLTRLCLLVFLSLWKSFIGFLQHYSPWHPAAACSIISYREPSGNCAAMMPLMNHLVSFGLVSHRGGPRCHLLERTNGEAVRPMNPNGDDREHLSCWFDDTGHDLLLCLKYAALWAELCALQQEHIHAEQHDSLH